MPRRASYLQVPAGANTAAGASDVAGAGVVSAATVAFCC